MKEGGRPSGGIGRSAGPSVSTGMRGASFGVRSGEMGGMRTIASAPRMDSFSNFAVIRNTGIVKPSGFAPDMKSGLSGGRRENFSGKDYTRMPKLTVAPQIPGSERAHSRSFIKNTVPLTVSGISKDTARPFSALKNTVVIARGILPQRESRTISQPAIALQIEQKTQQVANVRQKIQSEVRVGMPKVSEFFASSNKPTPDTLKRLVTRMDTTPQRLPIPESKKNTLSVLPSTKRDIQPVAQITPEQTVAAYKSFVKEKAKQVHSQNAPIIQEQTFKEPAVVREMEQAAKVFSLIQTVTDNNPALTTIRTSLERQTLVSVDQNITWAVARKRKIDVMSQPMLEEDGEFDTEEERKRKAKNRLLVIGKTEVRTNVQPQIAQSEMPVFDQVRQVKAQRVLPQTDQVESQAQLIRPTVDKKTSEKQDAEPAPFERDKLTDIHRISDVIHVVQDIFPKAQEQGALVDAADIVAKLKPQTKEKTSKAILNRYRTVVFDISNARFEKQLRLSGKFKSPDEAVSAAVQAAESNPAVQDGKKRDISEEYSWWVILQARAQAIEANKIAA